MPASSQMLLATVCTHPVVSRRDPKVGPVRTIRYGIEQGDARFNTVAAYTSLGIGDSLVHWGDAWAQVSAVTCSALEVLREEAHAGLPAR